MTKQAAVIHYNAAASIFSKWRMDGVISKDEYAEIDTIIAIKYGLSSCSIYRRNSLINSETRANMGYEGRPLYA